MKVWDARTGAELLTLRGHTDFVTSVAFSPDGTRLASSSEDQTIRLWDLASRQELCTLRGHQEEVRRAAFSPDGSQLASCSHDYTVKIWDVASRRELRTIPAHTGHVYSVAFSPDGSQLATSSSDHTAKLWDTTTGQELRRFQNANNDSAFRVVFSADGGDQRGGPAACPGPGRSPPGRLAVLPAQLGGGRPSGGAGRALSPGPGLGQASVCGGPQQWLVPLHPWRSLLPGRAIPRGAGHPDPGRPDQPATGNPLLPFERDLAFRAMAQLRLGQKEQARATFQRLDKVVKRFSANPDEARALLQEVNDLLESDNTDGDRPANQPPQSDCGCLGCQAGARSDTISSCAFLR